MARVYLDHAATSPLRPQARAAMVAVLDTVGNPSSIHAEGQAARFVLDSARRTLGELLEVRAERVVLTSGGTESANLALRGVMAKTRGRLLVSAVEHDCVLATARALGGETIPVDAAGVVRLDVLQRELAKGDVALVAVMHANNETGVLQPVAEIAALAHAHGARVYCDAVQTVGHLPVHADALGVDMLGFSAHKFGGPAGVGGLVLHAEMQALMTAHTTGGGQERHRRAGTENLAGIAGMAAALMAAGQADERARLARLRDVLEQGIEAAGLRVVAKPALRVDHVVLAHSCLRAGDELVMALDMAGVAASQGSACGSGRVEKSHVLAAMGGDDVQGGVVRFSSGWSTTSDEVCHAMAMLAKVTA